MSRNKGIRISEKHGVNPTIPICFWCGKEKNEIVLLGKLKGDAEAPRSCVINYEPCDKCKEAWKEGILFIEASTYPCIDNMPPIQILGETEIFPTGRHVLMKEEPAKKFIEDSLNIDEKSREVIYKKRQLLMQEEAFRVIFDEHIKGGDK